MYTVLVAVDRNVERAEAQADAVAALPEAPESVHAIIVHSFTQNPTGAGVAQLASAKHARERLEEAGIEVSMDETSGDPANSILELATEHGVDCIAIGGRRRTPAGKVLFGSVSQGVILAADRPVLICSPDGE
jgi:nucleotide-binding universal stress UspA family protein